MVHVNRQEIHANRPLFVLQSRVIVKDAAQLDDITVMIESSHDLWRKQGLWWRQGLWRRQGLWQKHNACKSKCYIGVGSNLNHGSNMRCTQPCVSSIMKYLLPQLPMFQLALLPLLMLWIPTIFMCAVKTAWLLECSGRSVGSVSYVSPTRRQSGCESRQKIEPLVVWLTFKREVLDGHCVYNSLWPRQLSSHDNRAVIG